MDPVVKDTIEAASWIAAVVGVLIAAFKALQEISHNREIRTEELRWKRAALAREILDRFHDRKPFRNAVTMLDWTGRDFEIAPNRFETIYWDELGSALRVWKPGIEFTDTEVFIRDSFDELFESMELLEHYLRTGLLEFADVQFPMAYHVHQLREHEDAVKIFLKDYDYHLALAFMQRFPIQSA